MSDIEQENAYAAHVKWIEMIRLAITDNGEMDNSTPRYIGARVILGVRHAIGEEAIGGDRMAIPTRISAGPKSETMQETETRALRNLAKEILEISETLTRAADARE